MVTDAGMPGASAIRAPGWPRRHCRGVPVISIPGANAAVTALVASGLPTGEFHFLAFFRKRAASAARGIEQIAG